MENEEQTIREECLEFLLCDFAVAGTAIVENFEQLGLDDGGIWPGRRMVRLL